MNCFWAVFGNGLKIGLDLGALLLQEHFAPEGKDPAADQDLPHNFPEEKIARDLAQESSGNHWSLAKLFQEFPAAKDKEEILLSPVQQKFPEFQESFALQDGMERITRFPRELAGLAQLREKILENDAVEGDLSEAKEFCEDYRKFLLSRQATIATIRTELQVAVSQALSDQDDERLAEEEFHGDGERDEPAKELPEEDNHAVKEARLKLALFEGLLEEMEEINFGSDADLAQSLEELEGVARDFYAYEEEWLWGNFQNDLQTLEGINSRHPSLIFIRDSFERLENLESPSKEDFQRVHILFQIYKGYLSAENLKPDHPTVQELREKIKAFEKMEHPAGEDYAELLQLSETAALWTHVEIKIDTYSQWIDSTGLTDGLINGAGLWDTGVHRSDEMLKAQTKYIEVHRLLTEGNDEAAKKLFIQLEREPEIYSLPSIAMASETINLCSISAGVVVGSAATAGLAAELLGGYLAAGLAGARGLSLLRMGLSPAQAYIKLSRRQELLVGLTKFGVNAATFTVAHQEYDTTLHGKNFFDPKKTAAENWTQLGWDTLMTAGMFVFLGGALKSYHLFKLPQIRQAAELRALFKVGGEGSKVSERIIQDEIEIMTKTGIEAIPYRLGAFGAELASFGIWESIQLGLEHLRQTGELTSFAALMAPLLSLEAWKQRFIFLLSLKAGNALVHPITKPIHANAREVLELKARHREILQTKERLTDPKRELRQEAQEAFVDEINQMESKDLLELVRQWNYLVDDEILSLKIQLKIFKMMSPEDRLSFVKGVERLITPEVKTIMSYFAAELLSKMVPHLEMKDRVERVEAMESNYQIADNQITVRMVAKVANYLTPKHRLERALKIERDVLRAEAENVDAADALIKIARHLSNEHRLVLVRQMLSRIPEEIWNYQDTQAVFRSIVGVIRLMGKESRFRVEEELIELKRHPNPRVSDFVTDILDHVDFFQNCMTRELGWQWGLRKILSEIDLILGEPKRYQFRDVPLRKIIPIHELDRVSPEGSFTSKVQRIVEKMLTQLKEKGWREGERPSRESLEEILRTTDHREDLPIVTAPTTEGYFLLLNGHHRLAALITMVADKFLPPETLSELPLQQSMDVNPYRLLLRFVNRESFEEIPSWNWSKVLEFHAESIQWLEKNGVTGDLGNISLLHGGHDGPVSESLKNAREALNLADAPLEDQTLVLDIISRRAGSLADWATSSLAALIEDLHHSGWSWEKQRELILEISRRRGHELIGILSGLPPVLASFSEKRMSPEEQMGLLMSLSRRFQTAGLPEALLLSRLFLRDPSKTVTLNSWNGFLYFFDRIPHNRRYQTLKKITATSSDLYKISPAELPVYLGFFSELFRRFPAQAPELFENILEAFSKGYFLQDLPRNEILNFISRNQKFSLRLFLAVHREGLGLLEEIRGGVDQILKDQCGVEEFRRVVREKGMDFLLSLIKSSLLNTHGTFIPKVVEGALLEGLLEIGDLRDHIPPAWRNYSEEISLKEGSWVLKPVEVLDPEGKIRGLVEQNVQAFLGDEITEAKALEALRSYIESARNKEDLEQIRGVIFKYLYHRNSLWDLENPDSLSYRDLTVVEELFQDPHFHHKVFKELLEKVPESWLAGKGDYKGLGKDVSGLVRKLKSAWNPKAGRKVPPKSKRLDILGVILTPFPPEEIRKRILVLEDIPPELKMAIAGVMDRAPNLSREKILQEILSGPLQWIKNEMEKFSFSEGNPLTLSLRAVKGPAHGLSGLCTGVCTAMDMELWKDPRFKLLAIIEGGKWEVVGYVHLYEVKIRGKNYLTLPGINPAKEFMGRVDGKILTDRLLEKLILFAKRGSYAGVYIPTDVVIFSNRNDIRRAIQKRKYPIKEIPWVEWNHLPKPFPFNKVYVVWEKGVPATGTDTEP